MLTVSERKGRIFCIDVLRGVCLVEMMANHLPANTLRGYATETLGFISAAEGFVFLSGFVGGWTSGKAITTGKTYTVVSKRLLSRAFQLYLTYLVFLTFVLVGASLGGSSFSEWRKLSGLGQVEQDWLLGTIFLHLPSYLDIFGMYCIFLLAVPAMLFELKAKRQWRLLAISGALWIASQFFNFPQPLASVQLGFFNLLSWQLIYTAGVVFGYRHATAEETPGGLTRILSSRWIFSLSVAVCIGLFFFRHTNMMGSFGIRLPHLDALVAASAGDLSKLVTKSTLGPLRLVNFACLACVLQVLFRRLGSSIEASWIFQRIAHLGQHSLQVFSWSVGVTFLLFLTGPSWYRLPVVLQCDFALAAIVSLWIPAYLHEKWLAWRRQVSLLDRSRTSDRLRAIGVSDQV